MILFTSYFTHIVIILLDSTMSPREEEDENIRVGEMTPSLGNQARTHVTQNGKYDKERQDVELSNGREHVAPDGGWGWIVVLECFMVHMVVDGITYTFGIILAEMVRSFQTGRSETSWVGSVQTCLMLLLGKYSPKM